MTTNNMQARPAGKPDAQPLTSGIIGAEIELARNAGHPSVAYPREEWDALSEATRDSMTRYGNARGIRIDTY